MLLRHVAVALQHRMIGSGRSDHAGFSYVLKVPRSPITVDGFPPVVLASDLRLTDPVDLAFTLQVPPAAVPTLLTNRCSSRLCVIAFARQPGSARDADHVLQEINVCTGE
ncbi:MAG: hypothetical protein ACR2LJ_07950 [Acidimicrobiales bacterium]